jgi:hypothetical protein
VLRQMEEETAAEQKGCAPACARALDGLPRGAVARGCVGACSRAASQAPASDGGRWCGAAQAARVRRAAVRRGHHV